MKKCCRVRRIRGLAGLLASVLLLCAAVPSLAEPEFAFARSGDFRIVGKNGRYGVIDRENSTVIPAEYDGILPIRGMGCVVAKNGYYGLWSLETRIMILECDYDSIVLQGRYAQVDHDSIWDLETGEPICGVPLDQYDYWIRLCPGGSCYRFTRRNVRSEVTEEGLMDENGVFILPYERQHIQMSEDGIVTLRGEDGMYRFFNPERGCCFGERYRFAAPFRNGFSVVSPEEGCWYLVDRAGERVTPVFERIADQNGSTERGCFAFRNGEEWFIGRTEGTVESFSAVAGPYFCDSARYAGSGIFCFSAADGDTVYSVDTGKDMKLSNTFVPDDCQIEQGVLLLRDGRYGFLFRDLGVIDPCYNLAVPFTGDRAFVMEDGTDSVSMIDRAGNRIRMEEYCSVTAFPDDTRIEGYRLRSLHGYTLYLDTELRPVGIETVEPACPY